MSIKVIRQVFNGYQGEPVDKLTLLALALFGNDEGGSIFPSVTKVGQMTNLSQRQARRNIRKLEDQGVISVIGNQNGGKAGTTRQYQINLQSIKPNKVTEDTHDRRIDDTEDMDDRGRRTPVTGDGGHGCPPISYITIKEQLNTLSTSAISVSQSGDDQPELVPDISDAIPAKPKSSSGVRFEQFWKAYPSSKRKGAKGKCQNVWIKKKLDQSAELILAHLRSKDEDFTKDNAQFCPAPLAYLNGESWDGFEIDWSKGTSNLPDTFWDGVNIPKVGLYSRVSTEPE